MIERIADSEDVDKSDLIISCEVCDQIWKLEETDSAFEVVFREEHQQQTGHTPNEGIPATEYFESEDWTEWVVTCETCDWVYPTGSKTEAEKVYGKHEFHTGHEADEIQEH